MAGYDGIKDQDLRDVAEMIENFFSLSDFDVRKAYDCPPRQEGMPRWREECYSESKNEINADEEEKYFQKEWSLLEEERRDCGHFELFREYLIHRRELAGCEREEVKRIGSLRAILRQQTAIKRVKDAVKTAILIPNPRRSIELKPFLRKILQEEGLSDEVYQIAALFCSPHLEEVASEFIEKNITEGDLYTAKQAAGTFLKRDLSGNEKLAILDKQLSEVLDDWDYLDPEKRGAPYQTISDLDDSLKSEGIRRFLRQKIKEGEYWEACYAAQNLGRQLTKEETKEILASQIRDGKYHWAEETAQWLGQRLTEDDYRKMLAAQIKKGRRIVVEEIIQRIYELFRREIDLSIEDLTTILSVEEAEGRDSDAETTRGRIRYKKRCEREDNWF